MQRANAIASLGLKITTTLVLGVVAYYLHFSIVNTQTAAILQRQNEIINQSFTKLKELKDPRVNAIIGIK